MAPKVNCNPLKLANIALWMQKSCVAHNIKDLEKALPSVASINGMQVKDYLQSLSDENKIRVEKIGSGNWYWSFASEAKSSASNALSTAQAAYDKQAKAVLDLQDKAAAAQAAREEGEDDMLDGNAESREGLNLKQAGLEQQCVNLKRELTDYVNDDPTEVERKGKEAEASKVATSAMTDQILEMERWFREKMEGIDPEALVGFLEAVYGEEWEPEDQMLRDLF